MMAREKGSIEEQLSFPILLADRIRQDALKAKSFKFECSEVSKRVNRLSQMLRSLILLSTTTSSLYEPPIRRIVSQVFKNFMRALTLIRKCKRTIIIRHLVTITSSSEFLKLFDLLDSSIADMNWLFFIFDYSPSDASGIAFSSSSVTKIDPILASVWSSIAAIMMGSLPNRVRAGNELAALVLDNDRNSRIVIEEGGIVPLLKLLKEGASDDAQIAAAMALANLATNQERVRLIAAEYSVPIIVEVLSNSTMRVQIWVTNLISRMAENDLAVKEQYGKENVIKTLVSLLSFLIILEDPKPQLDKSASIHSLIRTNKEFGGSFSSNSKNLYRHDPYSSSSPSLNLEGSGRDGYYGKVRENEKDGVKAKLKINCVEALCVLSRVSVFNCWKITEPEGLLCLAKIIENEQGELQLNCLMTVMEITSAAESNVDLRRAAFKINSPSAKAVVEQLLRLIREESSPSLQIPAIKSIGSLARSFPARETRVIGPLVARLSHKNSDVAIEAVIVLAKFVCPENFLRVEHSMTITESDGVLPLMRLMRVSKQAQLQGLILLCYLAMNVGNNDALEEARALTALEVASHSVVAQHPSLRDLIPKAIYHLEVYREGVHPHRQFYTM